MIPRSGVGDQVWPWLRRVIGKGSPSVSTLETNDGVVHLEGPGVRKHDDGTVTIAGSNVEVVDGRIRIVGCEVR